MNAPEGESTDRQDEAAEKDLPLDEIAKEKPVVRSSVEDEPEKSGDEDIASDKPNLPPAMPPMM
ncbi:MAG: hypothetical protein JO015_14230 [Verrucomicrobia bacterium]|nr:hypothetical protein [Verrucomicrobiota bacterium]